MNINDKAVSLLEGAYDLHVHTALDYRPRTVDDIELLKEADNYKMAGVIIKNHYESTQARASLANKYANTKTIAYGSISLNNTVGGLNPYAVENSLRQGAKMIWMPTMDSKMCADLKLGQQFEKRVGISIFNENGSIKEEVFEIIDLAKEYGCFIASGHLDAKEALAFCDLSLSRGAKTIMTHPDWVRSTIPVEIQKEYAYKGAFIEKVFWYMSPDKICQSARDVGVDRVFVVTDRGQLDQKTPTQAMLQYVKEMLNFGLTEKEIKKLICTVPEQIIKG